MECTKDQCCHVAEIERLKNEIAAIENGRRETMARLERSVLDISVQANEIHKLREEIRELKEHIAGWQCGCGWMNGVNLSHCARCGRTPNESR